MLNDEVVEAIEKGDFHVYPVSTAEEAIDKATALHGDITLSTTQETQARKL